MSFFVKRDTEGSELAFLQYMECVPPLDAVDDALGWVCLRWATTGGGEDERESGTALKENDCTVVEEWFGAISFQSILRTMHVA